MNKTVFTNGCFDILHAGHVRFLQEARALGDRLIVGVNSDASVRRLKGEGRPVNPLRDRVEVLRALECVDHVGVFDEDTPIEMIKSIYPDIHVKGGDYKAEDLPEKDTVERLGGIVVILPYESEYSTTNLIAKIKSL